MKLEFVTERVPKAYRLDVFSNGQLVDSRLRSSHEELEQYVEAFYLGMAGGIKIGRTDDGSRLSHIADVRFCDAAVIAMIERTRS